MAKRIRVLFLPHPAEREMSTPLREQILAALGERHDFRVFDGSRPLAPQFDGIDVVLDHGGVVGTREMADVAAGRVSLWQIVGTGVDHFDLDYWRSSGIPVANCPGSASAGALADCAMMFILMLSRNYRAALTNLNVGKLYRPVGTELDGLKLAVLGFGASGRELARRALPFGIRNMAIDTRYIDDEEVREYGLDFVGGPGDLDQVLPECDILSIHLPLNAETRHIIDARRLQLMKPTALLINVARGALVDEGALTKALVTEQIAGAGLDVFEVEPPDPESPLLHLPNVIATPHVAGTTYGTYRKRAALVVENVERVAGGFEPVYRVA